MFCLYSIYIIVYIDTEFFVTRIMAFTFVNINIQQNILKSNALSNVKYAFPFCRSIILFKAKSFGITHIYL